MDQRARPPSQGGARKPAAPVPNIVLTTEEGIVKSPDEVKGKLRKTQPTRDNPDHLSLPKKAKKQQTKPAVKDLPPELKNLTANQLEEMRESFNLFDKDKTGYITAGDIMNVLRSLGQNPTKAEITDILNELDDNQDGKIDFTEFCRMMSGHIKSSSEMAEEYRTAFQMFDLNGDGKINLEELVTVMAAIGEPLSREEAKEIFDMYDTNKDGSIDYKEFAQAMSADSILK